MTVCEVKLIETHGMDSDVTETELTEAEFREFMKLYKNIKGLR